MKFAIIYPLVRRLEGKSLRIYERGRELATSTKIDDPTAEPIATRSRNHS